MTGHLLPTRTHDHAPATGTLATLPDDLAERVATLLARSKAGNTRRAYVSDGRAWSRWCTSKGLNPLPASPATVAAYLADNAERVSVATLARHLSTISKAHTVAGHPSPCRDVLVRDTLAGLRRAHGRPPAAAPALMGDALLTTLEALPADLTGARDRALLMVGWVAALRRSEIADLQWGNVTVTGEGMLLTLEHSKTDHAGTGQRVAVAFHTVPERCAVRALLAWRDALEAAEPALVADDRPVFVRIDRWGHALPARLSGHAVAELVSRRTRAAGLEGFTGHSLRVGHVWAATRAGKSDTAIMQTTRHQSVAMLRRYQSDAAAMQHSSSRDLL